MGLLDLLRTKTVLTSAPTSPLPAVTTVADLPPTHAVDVVSGGTAALDRTAAAMLREYHRALYLWRCVDIISQMASSIVLDVAPLEDRELTAEELQIQALMLRPNPQWTAAALQYWLTSSIAVANKAFLKRVRSDIDGATLELWPVPANEVAIRYVNGTTAIKAFEHQHGMKRDIYPVSEDGDCDFIFVHRPVLHYQSETSTAAVAAAPAEVFTRVLQRCYDIVSNTSNISGILSTEAEIAQKKISEIKDKLMTFKIGGMESGGTLVTSAAKWNLTRLSEDPSTALSVEIKDSLARDVAACFGVPTQLLALPGQDTFNNLANARVGLLTETVLPGYINILVAALNHALMRGLTSVIKPNVEALPSLAQSRLSLVESMRSASMLSINEQRQLLGFPRYEDAEADVPVELARMKREQLKVEAMSGQMNLDAEG